MLSTRPEVESKFPVFLFNSGTSYKVVLYAADRPLDSRAAGGGRCVSFVLFVLIGFASLSDFSFHTFRHLHVFFFLSYFFFSLRFLLIILLSAVFVFILLAYFLSYSFCTVANHSLFSLSLTLYIFPKHL